MTDRLLVMSHKGRTDDTSSMGHVGGLHPARDDRFKILVGVFGPDIMMRFHGSLDGRTHSLVGGYETPRTG